MSPNSGSQLEPASRALVVAVVTVAACVAFMPARGDAAGASAAGAPSCEQQWRDMRGVTAVADIYEGDVVEMTQAQFLSICEANKGFGLDPADKNRRDHAFGECKKATDKTNCEVRGVLDYDCRNTHNPNPNETPQQCIERRLAGTKWDPKVAAASVPPPPPPPPPPPAACPDSGPRRCRSEQCGRGGGS